MVHATLPELAKLLSSSNINHRRDAAFSLSIMSKDKKPIIQAFKPLRVAINDSDYVTRLFAAHALSDAGESDASILSVYQDAMKNDDPWARSQACCGVRKNKDLAISAKSLLETALSDRDTSVVIEALRSTVTYKSINDKQLAQKIVDAARGHQNTPSIQTEAFRALSLSNTDVAASILPQLRSIDSHAESKQELNKAICILESQAKEQ